MMSLPGDDVKVLELTVPASGETDAGTFLVVVESDEDVESTWPWPETWPVQADS